MSLPSQGSKMQLAVAVPIVNNSFRLPTLFNCLINNGAGYAAGTSVFNIDGGSPSTPDLFLAAGDSITLGPSTDTSDSGKTENLTVASVTSTAITTNENSTIAVDDNDAISAIGNLCPGGWTPSGLVLSEIYSLGGGNRGVIGSGYFDNYRVKFSVDNDNEYLRQNISVRWLLNSATAYYRAGCFYKVGSVTGSFVSTEGIMMRVYGGASSKLFDQIAAAAQSSWTEYTSSAFLANNATGTPYIQLEFSETGGETMTDIEVDDIFLEHADGTDDAANGFWEFDEFPDRASITYELVEPHRNQRLPVNTLRHFDSAGLGDRTRKHVFNCEFSSVTQTFIDNLMILRDWSQRGWLLNLHTGIDALPPTLTGIMDFRLISKDHWDLTRSRITFSFLEV